MGGGPEHILFTLPFTRPDEAIAKLKKKFPDVKLTYKDLNSDQHVPAGRGSSSQSYPMQAANIAHRSMEGSIGTGDIANTP